MDHDAHQAAAVSAANRAFYEAFEAGDVAAMERVWVHGDDVTCVHPGWPRLRGWAAVRRSWAAILEGPERLQVILTDEAVDVRDEVAWVTVEENLLGGRAATVAAINVFTRTPDGWKMVAHHGSPVVARPEAIDGAP